MSPYILCRDRDYAHNRCLVTINVLQLLIALVNISCSTFILKCWGCCSR